MNLDRSEISLLVDRLDKIVEWVAAELENAITCQTAFTNKSITRVGKDEEVPLAFNERASDCGHQLLGTLRSWTNYVATEHGLPWPGDGRSPHFARWLSHHAFHLARTDDGARAYRQIIDAYNAAVSVVDRPAEKPLRQIDESKWAEARRLNLNARACVQMAHTMGAEYADLTQRRVKYLADEKIIAPVWIAKAGRKTERVFILGDVLDAHLKHPKNA
ncbi:hypothetical protein A5N77_03380 [Prescottella equi]|nr:hypothetical protein A5N77_03380 [Prescottella equi]